MEHHSSVSPAYSFTVPDYYEYLLVVHPPKEAFKSVMDEKEYFSDRYKISIARKTLPHMTVLNCIASELMEETMIKRMQLIIKNQLCFNVMLNNYSSFPSSKTIYARVQNHEPFKQLAASLKVVEDYVRSCGFPRVILISQPHMTIARRLPQHIYEKAVTDYAQKTFNASFIVNELILLKRRNQYDKCQQLAVFKLMPFYDA